jgi:hypothetical protein
MLDHSVDRSRRAALILAVALASGCSDDEAKTLDRAALLDPESCRDCHSAHYEEWAGSMHAYAADDPVFLAMNRRGQEETDGELGDFCVQCHAPMAVREGLTTDGLNLEDLPQAVKGVTCYFCHSVTAVEGTHNNPLTLTDDLVLRGPLSDPFENEAHLAEYSALLDSTAVESGDLCGSCHDIVTPAGVHLERTYSEWQQSVFGNGSSGGLSCASCHMETRSGTAADVAGVPLRKVHGHRMPGVDVALTSWPHHEEHLEQVAAEINGTAIGQLCVDSFDPSLFEVTMENAFAGHAFPSGATQDRRLWVELVAYDDQDQVIYQSGVVADDEPIAELADPDLWLFADEMFDEDDNVVHMFWEAARSEGELMPFPIDPNEPHRVSNSYQLPSAPARVTLRLRMRPMGLEVIGDLVDSGHLDAGLLEAFETFEALDPIEWQAGGEQCSPPDVF